MALIFVSSVSPTLAVRSGDSAPIEYAQVKTIVEARCLRCHSNNNTDENFKEAPKGAIFETADNLKFHKDKIITQVETKVMPLANLTNMTDDERVTLVSWLKTL